MNERVSVLGAGAWGTAVAQLLAQNGCDVTLWCYEPEIAQEINTKQCNERYLPGKKLNKNIKAVSDLKEALTNVRWVFEAVPVKFLRSVLKNCVPFFSEKQIWVVLSKGIENETLLFPGQIIDDVFKTTAQKAIAGGPSFSKDLMQEQVTAVTVASKDKTIVHELSMILANKYLRPYLSNDVTGVQLGGALKNIITLGIGILDGAGFTDNTKAFLFTCGLKEMVQCARELGAQEKTIYGFAGVGDLVLTSMGRLSRNLIVGRRLGSGQALGEVLKETGFIPEGINSLKSVHQLLEKHKLEAPVLRGLYSVIFEEKSIQKLLDELVARPLEWE